MSFSATVRSKFSAVSVLAAMACPFSRVPFDNTPWGVIVNIVHTPWGILKAADEGLLNV
ncbi:hypothetical protein GCM10027601_37430 [Nocardioides ungokensis]